MANKIPTLQIADGNRQEDVDSVAILPDGTTDNGNTSNGGAGGALALIPTSTWTQFAALTNMSGAGYILVKLMPAGTLVRIPCVLTT